MICPRCGAYNSNSAEQCGACEAPFDREARREGMAVEEDTGLASDPPLPSRWGGSPDERLASGAIGSALILAFAVWLLLGDPMFRGAGLMLLEVSLIGFFIIGIAAAGTGIYNHFRK